MAVGSGAMAPKIMTGGKHKIGRGGKSLKLKTDMQVGGASGLKKGKKH